jgi:hypothetical protein
MEAARTSETSVDIQLRTRQYIPEYSELRITYKLREHIPQNIKYYWALENIYLGQILIYFAQKPIRSKIIIWRGHLYLRTTISSVHILSGEGSDSRRHILQ